MLIGVTDTITSEDKYNNYVKWIEINNSDFRCIKLSYKMDNLSDLQKCDGLILTGGGDVDPFLYDGSVSHSKVYNVDRKRDDYEKKLVDKALNMNIPILAICRGMQLMNVHLGGTLITDLEEAGYKSHKSDGVNENRHNVTIKDGSYLQTIVRNKKGMVNSNHHQAIDKVGQGLRVAARSDDGVLECVEGEINPKGSFILLIQWHPECMDSNDPFSRNILEEFLEEVYKHFTNEKLMKGNI